MKLKPDKMHIDYLNSEWERLHIKPEYEEKIRKAFENGEIENTSDIYDKYPDAIDESVSPEQLEYFGELSPEQNNGEATLQLFDDTHNINPIWDNGISVSLREALKFAIKELREWNPDSEAAEELENIIQ